MGSDAPASRPKNTPAVHANTPVRQKSTPASSQARRKAPVAERPSFSASEDPFAPAKPKWVVPVVVALVVGLGGAAAYFLTRPQPTTSTTESEPPKKAEPPAQTEPSAKNTEFVPPAEVSVEIISSPEGATIWLAGENSSRGTTPMKLTLPQSTRPMDVVLKASGYLDKRLALDASRDRTMNVNLEPREGARAKVKASETEKAVDKSGAKKAKKSGGKSGGAETAGGFKPVGD
jgi:PEGA domain